MNSKVSQFLKMLILFIKAEVEKENKRTNIKKKNNFGPFETLGIIVLGRIQGWEEETDEGHIRYKRI